MADRIWKGRSEWAARALLLALAACGSAEPEPEDGGWPLQSAKAGAVGEDYNAHDPCFRKEHERWHYSIGHCRAMAPPQRLQGVWLRAFEVSQFVPRATSFAEASAREGQAHDIEIDNAAVERLAGVKRGGPGFVAYEVTFIGRRRRDPHFVDCQGHPEFTIVADRLLSAKWLGYAPPSLAPFDRAKFDAEVARNRARPVTVTVRHGGKWGQLEAEALARCQRDQMPSHARPA